MRNKIVLIIHAVLLAATAASAADGRIPGMLHLAPSPASLGRGGCGVSSAETDLFPANPAAIGGLRTWALAADYGTGGPDFTDRSAVLALPGSMGVLGLSFRHAGLGGSFALQADIGAAKELHPGLHLGAALHSTVADIGDERVMYGAVRAGLLARGGPAGPRWHGLGVHGFGMGASLRAGAGSGGSGEESNFDQASAGMDVTLYRNSLISSALFGEVSAIGEVDNVSVKTGIETNFDNIFALRAGWIARDMYHCGRYTLGAGIRGGALDLRGGLDYAVLFGGGYGETHYLGMTLAWGGPDMDPPEISAAADCQAFSPNFDGRQDLVVFRLRCRDRSDIRGWFFQVLDGQGRVMKEYRHRGNAGRRGLSILARALIESREAGKVPAELSWDGIDDNGRVHRDGEYVYSFVAWDEHDNISSARKGRVVIDTAVPEAALVPAGLRLNVLEGNTIEAELKVRDRNEDRVSVTILDEDGKTVRRDAWSAREAPARYSWDGKDGKGKPAKPGRYSLVLNVRDAAGNGVMRELNNLIVDDAVHRLDVSASSDYYSPALKEPLRFRPVLPKGTDGAGWRLVIGGDDPVRVMSGGALPAVLEWDGRTERGKVQRDDAVLYRIEVPQPAGTVLASPWKRLAVDSSPPELALDADSSVFSPDGDFRNDLMEFSLESDDEFGTGIWEFSIYSGTGALCYRLAGTGEPPRRVTWDGRGKGGAAPFSMETFRAELAAVDRAGNRAVSPALMFSTDIMLLPWQGMLRITFADSSDAARLWSEAKLNRTLERLADVLGDYPGYRMEIEAHADFEGDDQANLMASEKKAKYVRDFLAQNGFGERVMSFRGMGETRPLYGEDSGADRKKNGRIEVFLVPKAD